MTSPDVIGLTILVADGQNAHTPGNVVNVNVEPRFPCVLHTRLPDPIDALSLRPQKPNLKALDPAELL